MLSFLHWIALASAWQISWAWLCEYTSKPCVLFHGSMSLPFPVRSPAHRGYNVRLKVGHLDPSFILFFFFKIVLATLTLLFFHIHHCEIWTKFLANLPTFKNSEWEYLQNKWNNTWKEIKIPSQKVNCSRKTLFPFLNMGFCREVAAGLYHQVTPGTELPKGLWVWGIYANSKAGLSETSWPTIHALFALWLE